MSRILDDPPSRLFHNDLGRGTPFVTLHGGPGLDHTCLRPWLDPLVETGRLIYFDQHCQGRSRHVGALDGGIESWCDDVEAIRRDLRLDRFVLFGHSFGGFVALEYALRHADKIRGLVLCSATPVLDYPDRIVANATARGTPQQVETLLGALQHPVADDAALGEIWRVILPLYFNRFHPDYDARLQRDTRFSAAAFNRGFFECLPTFNVLGRLREIAVPTLVIAGRHDFITPVREGSERLRSGIPGAELVVFEDSGHFPFIEEQEGFLSIVRGWLGAH